MTNCGSADGPSGYAKQDATAARPASGLVRLLGTGQAYDLAGLANQRCVFHRLALDHFGDALRDETLIVGAEVAPASALTPKPRKGAETKLEPVKILVLGQGAREHAIVKALIRTGTPAESIVVAPGNAGISMDAHCEPNLNPNSPQDVTAFSI